MSERVLVENDHTVLLERDGLQIHRGWDDDVKTALIEGSNEEAIIHAAPQDARQRFSSAEAADEWYLKNPHDPPIVYTLGDAAIGGVIWFHRQTLPHSGAHFAFSIRMYDRLRGQRRAGQFMDAAHQDFHEFRGYNGHTWLSTRKRDNMAAIALFESHGYEKEPRFRNRFRQFMLRDPSAINEALESQYQASHDLNNL